MRSRRSIHQSRNDSSRILPTGTSSESFDGNQARHRFLPYNSLAVSRINSQILNEKTTLVVGYNRSSRVVVSAYRKMESRRTTTRIATQDSSLFTPMRFDPFLRRPLSSSLFLSFSTRLRDIRIYTYVYTHAAPLISRARTREAASVCSARETEALPLMTLTTTYYRLRAYFASLYL